MAVHITEDIILLQAVTQLAHVAQQLSYRLMGWVSSTSTTSAAKCTGLRPLLWPVRASAAVAAMRSCCYLLRFSLRPNCRNLVDGKG